MNKRTDGKAFDPATAVEFTAPINADAADADIVANAPATDYNFFLVPKVVE